MPPSPGNTFAVIPCLDEARTIGHIVRQLLPLTRSVIVVDDGSSDSTDSFARDSGAIVLRNPTPTGKGHALAQGWTEAHRLGASWVLLLDGDGQHAPEDAPLFFQAASPDTRLVVGNRMDHPRSMPPLRRWTNRWLSQRLSSSAHSHFPDSQCGYRLAHLPSLLHCRLTALHFEIESEMLLAFAHAQFPIRFVPIQVRYGLERSKIAPLPDTFRWIRWYLHHRRVTQPHSLPHRP